MQRISAYLLDHDSINDDYNALVKKMEIKDLKNFEIESENLKRVRTKFEILHNLRASRVENREVETFKKYSLLEKWNSLKED